MNDMTAVTLQFEDKLFSQLKIKAEKVGYSVNNYILHVLSSSWNENDEQSNKNDEIDAVLKSMQFNSGIIPNTENGKGALSQTKYM